jgi:HD-GYP domain-containing protein (c-di-GMP phosphodiesterase class II)
MSVSKFGADIIALLYTLVKAVKVYDLNNDVVQTASKKAVYSIKTLLNIFSQVQLVRYMDYVFFNKERLRFEIDGYASLQFIHDKLKLLGIKSLSFLPGIDKEELIIFASNFIGEKKIFKKDYASSKFKHITVEFSTEHDEVPNFLRDGERIKRTYFKALKVTKNLMQNLWMNQPVDVKSSRRIIYNLIDSLTQDEFGLLALTAIKNLDDYTYNHSLNVGILSLALGQRIGLSKKSLAKLGSAGILHDIGKVALPKELIYKSERLTNEEWDLLKKHSDYGVKEILKARGLDETGLISMTIAYQHHWNYNGTGYPVHKKDETPVLFSRIVRICDSYDAMTTPRIYQVVPYLPHYALRVMWKLRNVWFDPLLTKIFIQLLGLYPIGSCLELDNGEIALVIRENQGYPDRPIVKIILDRNEKKIDGKIIDLSMNGGTKIVKPIYAQKYGINPAAYFM